MSPLHATIRVQAIQFLERFQNGVDDFTSPYSHSSPANSFVFVLSKSLGFKGWRAVRLGILGIIAESIVGIYIFSHILDILPKSLSLWGPEWLVGPTYVLFFAFGFAILYRLIEYRDLHRRPFVRWENWGKAFWLRDLWARNIWLRFRGLAAFAILAIPALHHPHHIPMVTLGIVAAIHQSLGAIRAFRRELFPLPIESERSRGAILGKAIRQADEEGKDLQIALLDLDDLAAYGARLGFYGWDIINHILMHILWGPEGVIPQLFGPDVVTGNVGGDETYLTFDVPNGSSESAIEKTRLQLEILWENLRTESETIFRQLEEYFRHESIVENPRLPPLFRHAPPAWIKALRQMIHENGALPAITFSGGLISFADLKQKKMELIQSSSARQLFSLVRAALMGPVSVAKKDKYTLENVFHIHAATEKDIPPDIHRLETLFSPITIAQMPRAEREFVALRDPRKPFRGLKNIPLSAQFRLFDEWQKEVEALHALSAQPMILGSIRHWYGGPALASTLESMAQEQGVRSINSIRGGVKVLNRRDPTLSAVDLIVTFEHAELLKALNIVLGSLSDFRSGQFLVTVHAHAPDTLFFAWIPKDPSRHNPLTAEFKKLFLEALEQYQRALKGAIRMPSLHSSSVSEDIEIYPQVTLLETSDPMADLKNVSLKKVHDLLATAPDNPEVTSLFEPPAVFIPGVQGYALAVFIDRVTIEMERKINHIEQMRQQIAQKILALRVEVESALRIQKAVRSPWLPTAA